MTLVLLCTSVLVFGQTVEQSGITLSGIVVDKSDNPIVGAVVMVKGTKEAVVTDLDGNFMVSNLPLNSELEISCLGYSTKLVKVTQASKLTIKLEDDILALDETVVIGYGSQKRQNLTGAVATIGSEELSRRSVPSTANALQGLDPSINIDLGTGSPEGAYKIDIRGAVSINAGSPLILIDGVESSLQAVNPNDIESISILKDASASSIYGAKASAGVILVTTKSGTDTEGRASITYSGRVSLAQNTTSTDFITVGYDHVTLVNRFYYNSVNGGRPFYDYTDANGGLQKLLDRRNDVTENPERPWVEVGPDGKYYYYGNFDWFSYIFNKNRPQHEHNVSINGGTNNVKYYASTRYLNQKGIFKIFGDQFSNLSFRAKFDAKILPILKYSFNMNYDYSKMTFPGKPQYEQTIGAIQSQVSPAFIPVNPDGTTVCYTNQHITGSPMGTGMIAGLTANNTWNSKVRQYTIISNRFDLDIVKGLKLTAQYGYKMRNPINKYRNNSYTYSRAIDEIRTYSSGSCYNAYTENRYSETQGTLDVYGTYQAKWGREKNHNFTAVAGTQYVHYYYSTLQAEQKDINSDQLASFAVASGEIKLNQTINALKTLGFFGRVNYDYMGKYLLEVSARGDGSSRFAKGSRWGFFPSASLGWRISDEDFFTPIRDSWNNLKLRASVGSLGNQQVTGYYTYIDQITIDNMMSYTFDDVDQARYAKISNPIASDLTWETVNTYNFGIDMGFFKNRLTVTADAFIRDTKNMLTSSLTLPDVYGAPTPSENCADLRTVGYEIYVGWKNQVNLLGRPFYYSITGTFGDYISTITKFNNPDKIISNYYVGKRLGEIWGYRVDGLFATDQEAAEYQEKMFKDGVQQDATVNNKIYTSKGENNLRAGDVKFKDLNNDGKINRGSNTLGDTGDREVIGNELPRYNYSFRFDFNWYNFDLSAFFQGVGQRHWYPSTGQSGGIAAYDFWGPYAFPGTAFIHKDFEANCWTEDNTNAYFPRQRGYLAYAEGALGVANDRYLQNIGYLRLKNLSLGYTISFKPKSGIRSLRVGLSGENLWYWSPLKKYSKTMDPEMAATSGIYIANSGVGYFNSRVFSFNLDITF